MKTLNLTMKISAAVLIMALLAACSKNKDAVKKPTCRIITATPSPASAGDPVNFSYNDEGKLGTISNGDNTTTFAYSGVTAIGTTNNAGTFSTRKIITNNSNGLAANLKTEFDAAGTSWSNQVFEYSGTEVIKATSTSSGGGAPSVTTLTWSNGNLMSATAGANVTTLDYYTDKSAQTGDYLNLVQSLEGYQIYRTKNLIKSILSGSSITTFTYTFDGEGKITSLTLAGGSNGTYTYQHQCN